jgi:beta-lactamase class A
MAKFLSAAIIIVFSFCCQLHSQSIDILRQKIEKIMSNKNAVVGVSILGNGGKDTLSCNGESQFPMQSVFKFHIGIMMLAEIDRGKFSLDQKVKIDKSELLPGLWSPLRDKYTEGATITIAEILEYTVSQSDNAGCDVLLRLLGGPQKLEEFFHKAGIQDISIKINEEVMQNNWDLQFQNWTTPNTANQVLKTYFDNRNNLLSAKSYDFIWKIMLETSTGKNRLKGKLPEGTKVAHKTGWSGKHKTTGISAAVNDIGIVFLPDGSYFFISVFITDSKEDDTVNEQIIADIARETWDFFISY